MTATASLLWVPFVLVGAVSQLFRNSAQAGLTAKIGTLGATQVRFVFGLPFALLFLALALAISGENLPRFTPSALGWTLAGALCQIGGTAMMLVVMGRRDVDLLADNWTVVTKDGMPAAHFEHTVAVTENGADILTDGRAPWGL